MRAAGRRERIIAQCISARLPTEKVGLAPIADRCCAAGKRDMFETSSRMIKWTGGRRIDRTDGRVGEGP